MLPSEVTLHIGLQKTATTLIQRSLVRLRTQMASQGVAYVDRVEMAQLPAVLGWRAFPHPAEPPPELSPPMPTALIQQAGLADAFTDQLRSLAIARCEEVVAATGHAPRHLLVSNEALVGAQAPDFGPVYRPRAEAALRHVFEALRPARANLVLYVRRQDTLIESQYLARIFRGEVHDFADFAGRATAEPFVKFADLIERLRSLVPVTDIRIRPFETIGGGSKRFVGDLLAPLGMELDLTEIGRQRANPSYTAPALKAALALNPLIDTLDQLRATRQFLRTTFPASGHRPPRLFKKPQRREILDMYDESNRDFFGKYVPDARSDAYVSDEATATLADLV